MNKISNMKPFRTPDGTEWGVDVELPTNSDVLVVFHHPDGRTSRRDRYAWLNWRGAESQDVRGRLAVERVRAALDDATIRALFTRSMLIGSGRPSYAPA